MSAVDLEGLVPGNPQELAGVFRDSPGQWLPQPGRASGVRRWAVELAAGPLQRRVICTVGDPWVTGDWTWRQVNWIPSGPIDALLDPERLLPRFVGELGAAPAECGSGLVLRLTGGYTPPAGLPGRMLDAAGLRRVAVATARRFLDGVADALTDAAAHRCAEHALAAR